MLFVRESKFFTAKPLTTVADFLNFTYAPAAAASQKWSAIVVSADLIRGR